MNIYSNISSKVSKQMDRTQNAIDDTQIVENFYESKNNKYASSGSSDSTARRDYNDTPDKIEKNPLDKRTNVFVNERDRKLREIQLNKRIGDINPDPCVLKLEK